MASSSIGNIKKRPRGRPAVHATPVLVRLHPEQRAAVDEWRKRQSEGLNRPEAIRKLLDKALKSQ